MKVRVRKNNNDKILLSIGMIVKNEENHLENCMKALQPLREQVPSELIIVDTGSTDRTIEIAKKYADKFLEFEWCNDFSAARNYGLEKAEGKWFMFIDADEYFDEDISEMVDFFKYPEVYEKYNSASYIIRNYHDETKKNYSDFLGSRMVKLLPGVKFEEPIHEYLPMMPPHGYFGTVSHHYGYAFKSNKDYLKKIERNKEPLLEEYKNDPKNSRVLSHMVDMSKGEEKKKYLDEWLEVCREGNGSIYRNQCYKGCMAYASKVEDYDKVIELYDEYSKLDGVEDAMCTIQIYVIVASAYIQKNNHEEAYNFFEKYFEIYQRYLNNELDITDLRCKAVNGINPFEYQECVINAANCLFKIDRFDDSLNVLARIDLNAIDFLRFRSYSDIIVLMADTPEKFRYASNFYKDVLNTGNIDKINIAAKKLMEIYSENSEYRLDFAKEISKINSSDTFVQTMKLITKQDEKNIQNKVQLVINSVENWECECSELIYLAIKYNCDLTPAIEKLDYERLRNHFPEIAKNHDDYVELLLNYADIDNFTDSIKKMFWLVSALETAVLSSKELNNEQKHDLYYIFLSILSDYVLNIYNPELFNENDVEIMPPLHRFGYYMGCAFMAKNEGNDIAYIRFIKIALKNSEPMKDVVAFLLEEFQNELK